MRRLAAPVPLQGMPQATEGSQPARGCPNTAQDNTSNARAAPGTEQESLRRRRRVPTRSTPTAEAAIWRELLFKERAKQLSESADLGFRADSGGCPETVPLSDGEGLNDLDLEVGNKTRQLHFQNIATTGQGKTGDLREGPSGHCQPASGQWKTGDLREGRCQSASGQRRTGDLKEGPSGRCQPASGQGKTGDLRVGPSDHSHPTSGQGKTGDLREGPSVRCQPASGQGKTGDLREGPSKMAAGKNETVSDAALAHLLQEEEYSQETHQHYGHGPSHGPAHHYRHDPSHHHHHHHHHRPEQNDDHKLAQLVQEQTDAEMAMQLQARDGGWPAYGGNGHTYHLDNHGVVCRHPQQSRWEVGGQSTSPRAQSGHTRWARVRVEPGGQSTRGGHSGWVEPGGQGPRPHYRNFTVEQEAAQQMDMSYESLLELEDVHQGMDAVTLDQITSTHTYKERQGASEESRTCAVCRTLYDAGEELRTLPCFHSFHRSCVDKWLSDHTQCPVCMKDIKEHSHTTTTA